MESEQAGQVDITAIPTAENNQAMVMTNRFRSVPQLAINYYGLNYLVKPFSGIYPNMDMPSLVSGSCFNEGSFTHPSCDR
jgi:hypothetical protein